MEITHEKTGSAAVVKLSGDVDLNNSPQLRAALKRLVDEKVRRIVVDLGEVSYMDSSGVATLIECLQGLRSYGGELRLSDVPPKVQAVFALAQLEKLFNVFPSVEEALST